MACISDIDIQRVKIYFFISVMRQFVHMSTYTKVWLVAEREVGGYPLGINNKITRPMTLITLNSHPLQFL